jgi:hypothetical protein
MTEWEEKIKTMIALATNKGKFLFIKNEIREFAKTIESECQPGFCDCSLVIKNELEKRGIES